MERIIWSEKYSVGNRKLDNQHKKIINLINTLIDSPEINVRSEALHDVLSDMLKYFQEHLAYEESLLKQYDYPDFESHSAGHVEYLEKFSDLSFAAVNHEPSVPTDLIAFLRDWWNEHILNEDMKYKAFLASRGIN